MPEYRYKILIEYDGTDFSGWQIQPGKRTVQGIIQRALSQYTREDVKLSGAGRTDTGVHAVGQVGSFATEKKYNLRDLLYHINGILPEDVAIKKIIQTALDFDPRREALNRTYRYYIAESSSPLNRMTHYHSRKKLDIAKLSKAAKLILGNRDFSSFCRQKSLKDDNHCRVTGSRWFRRDGSLIYEITADRFLHNMVRRLVGAMLAVESSKLNLTQFAAFLNNKGHVRYSAEAKGLVLMKIAYRKAKR